MKVLVTGATGFLGGALARRLLKDGHTVTATGRKAEECTRLQQYGMRVLQGDLGNAKLLKSAVAGQDVIFHVAGLSSPWGVPEAFYAANVLSTQNIVREALEAGVSRLIYTGSPSIYINGKDRLNLKEDAPLPKKFANSYAETKHLGELEALKGHSQGLTTFVLRPQAFVGAKDRTIFPRLIRANREGGVPLFFGGKSLIDLTHIDNVVQAHVCSAHASKEHSGKSYNITNGTPMEMQEVLTLLFHFLNEPMKTRNLPFPLVYAAAGAAEWLHRALKRSGEPKITRYGVQVLARSRTLDISAAKKDLGYTPGPTVEQGLQEFAADFLANGGNS